MEHPPNLAITAPCVKFPSRSSVLLEVLRVQKLSVVAMTQLLQYVGINRLREKTDVAICKGKIRAYGMVASEPAHVHQRINGTPFPRGLRGSFCFAFGCGR